MTTEEYKALVEYYDKLISIDNSSTDEAKNLLYQRCITHSDIGYKYVDGLESFEEYDLKVNKLVEKIAKNYDNKK